jgi:hypothetical protein
MLSYFNSITVPGLEHITVFHDDEDATQFYAMPSTPRLARDNQGRLLLDLIIYARDADKLAPEDLEVQRGWVAASVELQLTADEHQKILDHLKMLLAGETSGLFLRILGLSLGDRTPKLALPPQFVDGTVTLTVPTPGGTTTALNTSKPSLIGTNLATIAGDLSQDSSELIRQSVLKGGLPMAAMYELEFLARIPAVEVTISGSHSAFVSETIDRYKSVQTVYHQYSWGWWQDWYWWTIRWAEQYATTNTSIKSLQTDVKSIQLTIDESDFRNDPESVKAKQEFEAMALKIFSDSVVPTIMRDVSAQFDQLKKKLDAEGKGQDPKQEAFGVSELTGQITETIDISLKKSAVIKVRKNPNGTLAKELTDEQVKKAITYLDLADPYLKELPIRVRANVNFSTDPVFALKVFVEYDQTDEFQRNIRVKKSETMTFTSANEVQSFRPVMARGSDGSVKDTYSYWSEIIYKETGQTIRVPAQGSLQARDTELVVSYRSLGFIKVAIALGTMPDEVTAVEVAIRYPRSNLPSASQRLTLTKTAATASFFTYTGHDGEPDPYRYSVSYVLADGQRVDIPEVEDRAENLTISTPFEDRVSTTFLAQAEWSEVQRLIIDARYEDAANDFSDDFHAELNVGALTVAWPLSLRDPKKLDFSYTTTLVRSSGAVPPATTHVGTLGQTVTVGSEAIDQLEVVLIPNLDWTGYTSVVVQLEYKDAANGVSKNETILLDAGTAEKRFRVQVKDPTKTSYRYRYLLVSSNPALRYDSQWQEGTDTLLQISAPATPPVVAPPASQPVTPVVAAPVPTPPQG